MNLEAVVLDIDGVLVNVADSYRRAIREALAVVLGESITDDEIQAFKDAGGFNDDWELTDAAALYLLARRERFPLSVEEFTDRIAATGGGLAAAETVVTDALAPDERERVLAAWNRERLREVFQQLYLGRERYAELEGGEPDPAIEAEGFIENESALIESGTLDWLTENFRVGVVTGRPAAEAAIALSRVGLDVPDVHRFTMDSRVPGKPDPTALVTLADRFDVDTLAFVGDTLDDVRTVKNATETDPNCEYLAIGVLTGGLTGDTGREAFERVEADHVLETINDIDAVLTLS